VGDIHLQDGRVLLIVDGSDFFNRRGRLFLHMLMQWVRWYIGWLVRHYREKVGIGGER